jgi:hypothetical protein
MTMRPLQRSEQRSPQRIHIRTAANRYDIDESKIPPNMDYNWKCKTIMGAENTENLINYEMNGWVPVPPARHSELTGARATQAREIVRGGLVLMERPKEVTAQARDIEEFDARNQVASQMQRLRLNGHRAGGGKITTSYEPIPQDREVPEDATL